MAITNAQQYKQLVNPPMKGKKRPGYRGDDAARSDAASGRDAGRADPGGGVDDRGSREQNRNQRNVVREARVRAVENFIDRPNIVERGLDLYKKYSPLGIVTSAFNKFGTKFGKTTAANLADRYGYGPDYQGTKGPSSVDDDDDTGQGDGGIPRWMQLGYPSQQAYMAAMQRATQAPAGLPAAVQPMQTMDLNRIAYRLMADGGFLGEEDEPRQAYGLGSFVKKVVKKATTLPRKLVKTVKKVAKSPTGRLLLAVAAPYALGPAVAQSQFLAGLSAAKKAALISGATTGITQLASGEDLDLKDIALSAAIGGGTAKMFPGNIPGKPVPQGVSGSNKALFTSDAAMRGTGFGGNIVDEVALTGASDPSKFTAFTKDVLNPQTIKNVTPEKTGILQTLKDFGTKIKDSKLTDIIKTDDKISPMKSILLASALSGLAAKKDQEPDEFSEMDRGEGIDIAAIRRRPFEYMAPRFAGSEFDFYAADGGRIGYQDAGAVLSEKEMKKLAKSALYKGFKKMYSVDPQMAKDNPAYEGKFNMFKKIYDQKFQKGGKAEPVAKKVMPLLDMGGMEKDYRAEGGFVPIGRMEKADDVPARLSKNEFVFTADAVRNAGDGDVDKGAEVMYNMMKNLEAGGDVSEESQGLKGARRMFQTSQRLEEVL